MEKHPLDFESIYQAYYRPLYFYAHELVADQSEAQDIVADAFVKYYQRLSAFSDERQVKSFLYTTTRHAALNSIRDRKKQAVKLDEIAGEWEGEESTFLDKLVLAELMRQIAAEVDKLPDMQQKIFRMSYLDGKSTVEIGEELGIPAESVYNNKKRAVEKLKKVFKDQDFRLYLAFLHLFFWK